MTALLVHRVAFPAMGSTVELTLIGGDARAAADARALAVTLAAEWDATFSRFRPDSELMRHNTGILRASDLSPRLASAVALALAARTATHGLFDPTILSALLDLGYDRTFDEVGAGGVGRGEWGMGAGVEQSHYSPFPMPHALDLGGIAKGLYADELAARLARWAGGCVSAGGDLRVWGVAPDGSPWRVGVEDPDRPERDLAVLELHAGGVATSGTNRRSWQRDGRAVHHLVDPRTGQPAASGLRAVTVVATNATQAEVWSTAVFVGGLVDDVVELALAEVELVVAVPVADTVRLLRRENGAADADGRAA